MKRVAAILITLALIAGMAGCPAGPEPGPPVEYSLIISTSEGGEVTTPGEGVFVYSQGEAVSLVATPASGHYFAGWTGDVGTIGNPRAASTTITMNGDYSVTANFQVIPVATYSLTIASTEGGSVTAPGEGTYTYDAGTVAELVAEAEEGYQFTYWTGSVGAVDDVNAASTTVTMIGDYTITAAFAKEVRTWYDLDAIRDNLGGSYVLMDHLDFTAAGYSEVASQTANDGKGWEPVGTSNDRFTGSFDGQGYEIRDLSISRPDEDGVGLFGLVDISGAIENVGVVNAEVTGRDYVGGVVGWNYGTVSGSYSTGSLTGRKQVGGLVAVNGWLEDSIGIVTDCYSTASVTGGSWVGGLVGWNYGTVSGSYSTGSLAGEWSAGGLVGVNSGTVVNSYSSGSVTGGGAVGGLVGVNGWYYGRQGTVSNSYYSYDDVLINSENVITVGALFKEDFDRWLAEDKFLDVGERLAQEDGYYLINDVSDFKQLLAFGQDDSLKFRLESDLDLGDEPDFYIPYLAGEFDGNSHKIANLSFGFSFVLHVGLFGYLTSDAVVTSVGAENVNIACAGWSGGLVGENKGGTVSNSYSTGSVTGWAWAGGLLGLNHGIVSNCYSTALVICGGEARGAGGLLGANAGTVINSYSTGSVSGGIQVGGLMGANSGTVSNSYYDYDEVLINGENVITVGALLEEDFDEWLTSDKFLDANERLSQEDGYYLINDVSDLKQLLAFGQDDSLKFRLMNDLDLGSEPNFYVPYLAGEFDGNGHTIANLSFDFGFVGDVGLFGYIGSGGAVNELGVEDVSMTGGVGFGGLAGANHGTVSGSYSSGSLTCTWYGVGGLVAFNYGTISNSFSRCDVTGGDSYVGGLVGSNGGTVTNSYSSGHVTGNVYVGGLVGYNWGAVSNSFWDVETSGAEESDGGAGKTTAEMKDIATFVGGGWDIISVTPNETNPARIWNIVDGQTYPFLSWQPVS